MIERLNGRRPVLVIEVARGPAAGCARSPWRRLVGAWYALYCTLGWHHWPRPMRLVHRPAGVVVCWTCPRCGRPTGETPIATLGGV